MSPNTAPRQSPGITLWRARVELTCDVTEPTGHRQLDPGLDGGQPNAPMTYTWSNCPHSNRSRRSDRHRPRSFVADQNRRPARCRVVVPGRSLAPCSQFRRAAPCQAGTGDDDRLFPLRRPRHRGGLFVGAPRLQLGYELCQGAAGPGSPGPAWKGTIGHLVKRLHLESYVKKNVPRLKTLITGLGRPALAIGKTVVSGVVALVTLGVLTFFILLRCPEWCAASSPGCARIAPFASGGCSMTLAKP